MLNTKEIRFFQKIGFLKPPFWRQKSDFSKKSDFSSPPFGDRNPIFPKNRISHNVQYLVDPYRLFNIIINDLNYINAVDAIGKRYNLLVQ